MRSHLLGRASQLGEEVCNSIGGNGQGPADGLGKAVACRNVLRFDPNDKHAIREFIKNFGDSEKFAGIAFVGGIRAVSTHLENFGHIQNSGGSRRRARCQGIHDDNGFAAAQVAEQR